MSELTCAIHGEKSDSFGCSTCFAVTLGKVAQLHSELEAMRTQHKAWTDIFGTTQLTHAWSKLEEARKNIAELKSRKMIFSPIDTGLTIRSLEIQLASKDAKLGKAIKVLKEYASVPGEERAKIVLAEIEEK